METTEFMMQLAKQLMDERKIAESTANAYIRTLYQLNGKKSYKNLTFLKNTEGIDKALEHYADTTRRAILGAVVGVLNLFKDKPTFKKVHAHYSELMNSKNKEAREEEKKAPNEKTEKQKDNWVSWEDVMTKRKELTEDLSKFVNGKTITSPQYDRLLQNVVLSLYTDIQPRRNEYLDMYIVKKWNDKLPTDKNYLDMTTNKFVFNKYKTSKKYGQQTVEIPADLLGQIHLYLKFHPLWKGLAKRKPEPVKFLVSHEGTPLVALNTITRILNRIFSPKKVGSSLLRHIYISDKYKEADEIEKERAKDAEAMGHSVNMQKSVYFKKEDEPESKGGSHSEAPTLVISEL
jgi:hypothetical protein